MTWPRGDPDAVVRRILAGSDFRTKAAGSVPEAQPWWITVWRWIGKHILDPIFSPIGHLLGSSRIEGQIFGLVLIAASLCGLAFVIVRLILAFAPGAGLTNGEGVFDLSLRRTREDWLAAARAAAARGDFRAAIAALFAAALAALDDAGVIGFDSSLTPGEYRRMVRRARADASVPFDELAERFVRATYAEAEPQAEDYGAAERALSTFTPLVRA